MQLAQWQQEQQSRQRQQAALEAAGNALPALLAGQGQAAQMPPPPQTPNPGQPSRPQAQSVPPGMIASPPSMRAQQPVSATGAAAPLPSGPMPAQIGMPPLPASMRIARGQQGIAPFRPLPSGGSPAEGVAPQISAPPSASGDSTQAPSGPLTLENAIKVLKDQGLSGADLMAGLQQLTPVLDAQAKAQTAQLEQQFNREMKLSDLQYRYDALRQRADDNALNRADREQAHADSMAIRGAMLSLQREKFSASNGGGAAPASDIGPDSAGNLPPATAVGGYSGDAIDAMARAYAQGNTGIVSGLGRNKADRDVRAQVISRGAAYQKGQGGDFASSPIEYKANARGAIVNAQQAAKVDAAANALVQQGGIGDQYQESIDALDRTRVPIANEAQMAALRAARDPRVATYDTAKNGVVSEAAQILGRGTLTVNSMEEARKVVDGWTTSEQARAGIAQLKREAGTTVKASRAEVKRSAGGASNSGAGSSAGGVVDWGDLK
ncbi:hypothetical protein [Paraburkholderia sp. CNPSo 3281]|uniref:hypothetical protein n=1 Tax=Paraburkholderia sp. CNPSo 3281 TaxID=2940933 RepID=UPI0020B65116|nr:hypothetical protein [Paraburkholderia sp. CNPSo 3281]MCP3714885.1 hypothetical protein [Paraburkholderia sp. CNPSo 3281]